MKIQKLFNQKITKIIKTRYQDEQASSIQKCKQKQMVNQLLNLAETSVQMISHNDGYKDISFHYVILIHKNIKTFQKQRIKNPLQGIFCFKLKNQFKY